MFSQQPDRGRLEQNPIWVLFIEGFCVMIASHFQLLTHRKHQNKMEVVIAFFQKINRASSVSPVSFNLSLYQILAVATWLILYSHILRFLLDNQKFFPFVCISLLVFLYSPCRRVNASLSRRSLLSIEEKDQCQTGNPIDDCWRCDPDWSNNRQRFADCAIGFGQGSLGGRGGQIYVVTDSSDHDPAHPTPGTLRYAVIQEQPLWIIFSSNMAIKLKHELIFNSYKTIDGRGANVHITGNGCITIQFVTHIIIHNIHVHHCKPSGNTNIASSPTQVVRRGAGRKSGTNGVAGRGKGNIEAIEVSPLKIFAYDG